MKSISRVVIWAALGAVILLGVLSIVGAFIGVQDARFLFNSLPLAIFWVFLIGLLISGLFLFKRLRQSFGLLAGHVGPALILIGAILGSDSGQAYSKRFFGTKKIPSGSMTIFENHSTTIVSDAQDKRQEIGKLPFKVGLKDFWIEYYDEESAFWRLGVDAAPAGSDHMRRRKAFDWTSESQMQIPFVGLTLEVLQFLPHARPGLLEITQADGEKTVVSADLGREVSLGNSKGSLRIAQVFSHLTVQSDNKVVNLPGSNANPALKIEFDSSEKEKSHLYVYANPRHMHGKQIEGVKFQYLPKKDPTSDLAAMEVLISKGDKNLHAWLMGRGLNKSVSLILTPLLDAPAQPAEDDGHGHDPNTYLVMARRPPPIKDYKSRLAVLDEGTETVEKVIEVNDPLHYGGYHFYQNSYGNQHGQQYTVLFVKSDAGLWYVYAGFALLCAGVFWLGWVRPGWAYLMKRRDNGN